MKHIRKWMSLLLTVIMLVQLVSGIIPTLAVSNTAELTDHSFHGEGLWLTELYPNDTDRSKTADDRAATGCIPVTTFDSASDLMEFVEVISTHDGDFKLNDVYEIYANSNLLPITTMSGSSDITVKKGQPIVIWNERTDVRDTDGITLPTEAQIRNDLRIPDNALLLKCSHGKGFDNVSTFTIKLKSTGATFCTYTPTANVDVKDGLSCELKMPFWKSETTMELYQGMNLPSPGYVYHDQVRGYIKSIVPDDYTGKVAITEVRPNDVNRSSSYGSSSDYMECFEVTNTTNATVTLNKEYQLVYSYQESKRKLLPVYQYSSSASNHVGSSSGCTIPAGGTAVIWIYRYASLNASSTSFPTLTAFRNAYGISGSTPVYIATAQDSLNNTLRGLEVFSVDASGNPHRKVSSVFYYGDADVPDNTSATYKVRHDGPGMATYATAVATTMGTVEAEQTKYIKDTGLGIELRLHDGVTVPDTIMQGEDLRVNFYYEYDSRLSRLDTSVYYRFDGTGDWYRQTEGGMRVPNMYESVLAANELFDHKYVEFYITSTNPYRTTAKGVYRVNIQSLNTVSGIRTNISEGEEVRGTVSVTANDGGTNSATAIYIDGTKQTTTPMIEDGAYLTFYADGRDAGFRNALTTTGNKIIANISAWQYAVPNAQTHFIDNSYFTYSGGNYKVTLRLWAGTFGSVSATDITPSANREDYKVSKIKLKLANGNSYLPSSIGPSSYNGVDTSAKTNLSTAFDAIHCIGDSNKWCPYMDMSFTVPSSAVNAVGVKLDTTKLTNGEHTLKVTNGTSTKTVKFIVDNTAPNVNMGIASGATLAGNIRLNPTVTEANRIQKIVTTLDGEIISTPLDTNARLLGAGSHTLQTVAEDAAGNTTTKSVTFQVKDVSMAVSGGGATEVTHNTANLYLTAQTGSATAATFYKARKIEPAAVSTTTSAGILPYIQYVINVGEVDADDEVMVSWNGSASGSDSTHANTLFVRNIRSGAWDKIATVDATGSVKNAGFSVTDHVENGTATVIVQCTADSRMPDTDTTTDGVKGNNSGWDGTKRPDDYDFAFAWISDTQGYVQRYDYHFDNMARWLAENAEEWKIKYLMHTGDVVDDWDHRYQWVNADRSMKIIEEAGIPYGVLGGNHDVASTLADNDYYWEWFGEDRVKDQPTFGESYQNNLGHYDLVSQNGQDFIIVYMSWNVYQEEIDWMNEVLAKYADRKAILCFHAYTHTASSVDGLLDYYGVMIRDKVVKKNKNVFAVLNGHYFGSTYQTVRFDDNGDGKLDRTVYQICTDYQTGWHGGAEYMKFFYFDLDNDQIYVNAYSSYYDEFNYYDTAVHDLTAKAKAASNGVASALDVDALKMTVDFDTTKQTITEGSFSAYLATNEELGTATVTNGQASLDVTGLTSEEDHFWYADLNNTESGYLRTGVYEFTTGANPDYYLFGYINGADYACQGDAANLGRYKFDENGMLAAIFTQDSYVGVKNGNNTDWYMTQSYCTDTSTTLYKTTTGASEKLFVPAYKKVVFTLTDNGNGTLKLSYQTVDCVHNYQTVTHAEPTCTQNGARTHTCQICTYSYTETLPALGHQYQSNRVDSTCNAPSYTEHVCSICQDRYVTDTGSPKGHSFDEGMLVQAATCLADGMIEKTCTACGATRIEKIPATGHSHRAVVTAPTCTDSGFTTYTCHCGDSYVSDRVNALGHSYQLVNTREPACEAAGANTYRCSLCGDTYADILPATGHSYTTKVTAPTCTDKGYTTYTCACGHSYKADEVAALGHKYQVQITTNPGCDSAGVKTFTCETCGHQYTEPLAATGHHYTSQVTAPTCTEKGYTTYTCACGHSYKADEVAALGHSFAEGICGICGAADPDYVKPVVKPTLTLKSPTLEFKDMITVNAMFTAENIDDVVEMGMITYTEKVDVWNVETAAHVIPGTTYDAATGRYIAHSQGINAKYLGDTVYLACYAKLSDGSYVYTKLAPYSPVQYATNQLKNSSDMKLKQLVAAMLNYGAQAQLFFGHNTDNLANATLTDEQKTLPEAYRSEMVSAVPTASAEKQGIFANNKGFAKRYPSISFEGAFCINYFFKPNYAPVGDITLYYWNESDFNAADVLTKQNASGSLTLSLEDSGEYRGDIEGIAAKNLSASVFVAAVYSDGTTQWTSGVLGYSIGAYCGSQISKGADVAALAEATAVYGYHAKQYFAPVVENAPSVDQDELPPLVIG